MILAEPLAEGSSSTRMFFYSPTHLRAFVTQTDGVSLPLRNNVIPFILEQSPRLQGATAGAGFVFVSFQVEFELGSGSEETAIANWQADAAAKIQASSDDVFSLHFFTDLFGYVCFGSSIAAQNFPVGARIDFPSSQVG